MPFSVFSAPSSSYLFPLFFFQKATIHGEPKRVEHMGDTEIPYSIFFDFILTLSENSYRWVECISGKKRKIRRPINSPHPRKKRCQFFNFKAENCWKWIFFQKKNGCLDYDYCIFFSFFRPLSFDIRKHNSTKFCDDVLQFTLGVRIPKYLLEMPQDDLFTS